MDIGREHGINIQLEPHGGGGGTKPKFEIGEILYSPYKPPKGVIPSGSSWVVYDRHVEKGYPVYWELRETSTYGSEVGSHLPTLTPAEKPDKEKPTTSQKPTRVWGPKWDPNLPTPGEADKD